MTAQSTTDASLTDTWARLTRMPAEQGQALLQRGLPDGTELDLFKHGRRPYTLIIHRQADNEHVIRPGWFCFRFEIGQRGLHFDRGDSRHPGIAARIHRNVLALARQRNARQISVYAATVGAYLWATAGYRPYAHVWRNYQNVLAERFEEVCKDPAARTLPAPTLNLIGRAIQHPDPRSIWTIADCREPFNDTTVGKRMLVKTCWSGACKLHDPAALARLQAFTTGTRPDPWVPPELSRTRTWLLRARNQALRAAFCI